ncbi:MAG: hypothetical protein ACTSQG_03610, partial [Promethearchaeota archaeon]
MSVNQNKKWVYICILAGILMILGAFTGNLVLFFLTSKFANQYIENEVVLGIIIFLLIIFGIIAHTGGIAVIIGTLLITLNHYRLGKILSSLGTGIGVIGALFLIFIELLSGTIMRAFEGIIFGLTTISGVFGITGFILAIIARKKIQKPEISTGFSIKKHLKKENVSTIIIFSISTFFFIFFEILIICIFSRLWFVDLSIAIFWQLAAFSLYLLTLLMTYYFKYFRLIYINIVLVITIGALMILFQLNSLIFAKVFVSIIFIASAIGSFFSLKYIKYQIKIENRKKVFLTITLLFSLLFTSIIFLTVPKKRIIISPSTSPELIFWADPYYLPDDNETLEICKEYNIGFMPAVAPGTLNESELMDKYKLILSYGINLYFCLITPPDSFANIDNIHQYIPLYKDYRQWFKREGIFSNSHIKSFLIDAEPPKRYTEKIAKSSLLESVNYYLDNFPTKEEKEQATKDLNRLVDLIRSDDKEAGIIRIAPYFDEKDGDGDIELFLRNLYSLNVEWDYSITMIYRTTHIATTSSNTWEGFFSNVLTDIFGLIYDTEENVMSAYSFYHQVGIEQTKGQINAENQYIFIGTLKEEFNETEYIKNKEYLDDLDICRHFGEKKVFLYNYKNFLNNYGEEELERLGEHNEKYKTWVLDYNTIEIQANIIFNLFLTFIDRL